ncbi:MAG: hypothetical protein CVV02_02210 [Firmicutes bacterium HGW-Firmicutes-7]|nr:MAG: hypothetical protein CVV02_02210 [Firmicutes bacterium HGW-Firmicutes-7]
MFCSQCGNQVDNYLIFCPSCGKKLEKPQEQNQNQSSNSSQNISYQVQNSTPSTNQQSNSNFQKPVVDTTSFLVWSILNTIFCCLPLGIVGIVYVSKANSALTQVDADQALATAKIVNIIGTISGFLIMISIFILSFASY